MPVRPDPSQAPDRPQPSFRTIHWSDLRDVYNAEKAYLDAKREYDEWKRAVCWDDKQLGCHPYQWFVELGVVVDVDEASRPLMNKVLKRVSVELSKEASQKVAQVNALLRRAEELKIEAAFRLQLLPSQIEWKSGKILDRPGEMVARVLGVAEVDGKGENPKIEK